MGTPLTPECARCVAANLNSLDAAILSGNRAHQLIAISTLRANLFAVYYDALPLVDGQKNWPQIKKGDTWDFNGRPMPYPDDALTPVQPEF